MNHLILDISFKPIRDDLAPEVRMMVEEIRAELRAMVHRRQALIDRRIDEGIGAIRAEFEPRLRNVELAVKWRKRA